MRRSRHVIGKGSIVACVLAIGVGQIAARAQESRSTTLLTTEHYLEWERVNDAQIAPDGSRIVYTRQAVNALEEVARLATEWFARHLLRRGRDEHA